MRLIEAFMAMMLNQNKSEKEFENTLSFSLVLECLPTLGDVDGINGRLQAWLVFSITGVVCME